MFKECYFVLVFHKGAEQPSHGNCELASGVTVAVLLILLITVSIVAIVSLFMWMR